MKNILSNLVRDRGTVYVWEMGPRKLRVPKVDLAKPEAQLDFGTFVRSQALEQPKPKKKTKAKNRKTRGSK